MAIETLTNVAADLNLQLMQGKYWSTRMTIKDSAGNPVDVTGYTFRGEIRKTATSELIESFRFTVIDAAAGSVKVELLSAQTALLDAPRYMFDWEYTDGQGEEQPLVKGLLYVVFEVTHD